MKFLEKLALRKIALVLLCGVFVIFLIEFLIIRNKIERLEEIEQKKDFARSNQINGQQIAYVVQLHLNNNTNLTPDIYAGISELDHKLIVLGAGGRIDGSEDFIKPLSRLPAITYSNLYKSWQLYRENILAHLTVPGASLNTNAYNNSSTNASVDSLPTSAGTIKNTSLLAGQWLTLSGWFEKLLTDLSEEAGQKKSSVESWFFFFAFMDVLLLGSLFYFFLHSVIKPIELIKTNAINRHQNLNVGNNELGDLTAEINEILEQLQDATEFVAAIGEGKLDFDYKTLDEGFAQGKNQLADSLISMQGKLKSLNEEEHRRQWANEGLTKFVDILRSSSDNISTLGDKIISALVKYTNANQGGLYVLNDEEEKNKYLELISLFAFDNKKFETQKLRLGEGILGQTFLEKETTILNEIPDEYVRITSGLGGANPKSLLIVPLKVDKEVYGIVELASFKNFQTHEIAFVEKLAETIASTLASVKVAQRNRHLIEQFQQQTEEMRAQEEEMRQNMEELQATQEELSRKEQDYIARIRQLEHDLSMTTSTEEYEKSKMELNRTISDYHQKVRDLEVKLSQKPREDDWALAEEVEKVLRIQLDSLKITKEESNKK